jgi:tetratricopeptide (TPR) repeat protein
MRKSMNKRKPIDLVSLRNDPEFYFKIGQKYVKKKSLGTALRFINRAVDIEPYNADYQFNFACLLAELKQPGKSNDILLSILKNIDPKLTECYFGIGCNYFDLADFIKAREYFEKYVYFDPDGQFIDEAYDILNYLQFYGDAGVD